MQLSRFMVILSRWLANLSAVKWLKLSVCLSVSFSQREKILKIFFSGSFLDLVL